jgi:hypothetical protein
MPAAPVINSVTVKGRYRRAGAGAGTTQLGVRYSGTNGFSGGLGIDIAYADYSYAPATAPGSVAWTQSVLDSTEVLIYKSISAAADTNCTKLWVTVDYDIPGGFFLFMGSLVAGLQVFPFPQDFQRHVGAWLRAHPQMRVSPAETVRAWEAYRASAFPRHFEVRG